MFWAYNTTSPQIDIILCKEDLTLHELLDQENVLQELKAQNLKLIEFLLKPEILQQLVTLIITEPSSNLEANEQYKYPNLACELLTSDLPAINERLASDEMLNRLYGFLQNEPPLNPLLSSFFSRTVSILISRKSEQNWYSYQYTCLQALEFLKAKDEFMELLLKHMGTSSIMDLMHNLVTLVEGPELKQTLRSWLQSQNVIPNLIGLLSPNTDADCQMNAASVLCSIIRKLRENMPESDPILNLLESSQTIELILTTVFDSDEISETSIESSVDLLLELIQPHLPDEARSRRMLHFSVHDSTEKNGAATNHNTFSEPSHSQRMYPPNVALSEIVTVILPFIKKMKFILQNPIKKTPIKLTSGIISPPFGKARLLVSKFITNLISLNNVEINKEIILCDIPELLLDLFYAYSSNNFLHTEMEKLIAYVIDNLNENYQNTNSNDDLFMSHLLNDCNLLQRILEMWKENAKKQLEGQCRKGYMGHVIRIASLIHLEDEKMSSLHELLSKLESNSLLDEWNDFVNDTLKSIIETHHSCLGGICPKSCQSSENSFEECVYKDMKSAFRPSYEQDNDQNGMYFNISSIIAYDSDGELRESSEEPADDDEEDRRKLEMFNVVCAQKWQSFNKGLDNLDDDFINKEFQGPVEFWNTNDSKSEDKFKVWDSDDENLDEEIETNNSDPWSKLGNASNPWTNVSSSSDSGDNWNVSTDSDWANFDDSFGGSGGNGGNTNNTSNNNDDVTFDTNVNDETPSTFNDCESFASFANSPKNEECSTLPKNMEGMKLGEETKIFTNIRHANSMINDDEVDSKNRHSSVEIDSNWNHNSKEDGSDEMLDLESISGNTLAEKIANAENDIRNKDEECLLRQEERRRHRYRRHEKTTCSFSNTVSAEDEYGGEMDIDTELSTIACGGGEESLADDTTADMIGVMSQQDCLTENSVDFMTAENSTSDAESSLEFGDAENSLDDDDENENEEEEEKEEDGGLSTDGVEKKTSSADPNANLTPNKCNECGGEKSNANVPRNKNAADNEENRIDKADLLERNATIRGKYSFDNGNIVDGNEEIVNCDKSDDSNDH